VLDKIKAKKVLIVTGEASGDLHASYLVQAMLTLEPDVYCYGMGGEKLRAAGAHKALLAGADQNRDRSDECG